MKVPLEPNTTEQTAAAQAVESPRNEVENSEPGSSGLLNKAYPWLLGSSVILSAVLCWMYVTKPVMAPAALQATVPQIPSEADVQPVKVKPLKNLTKTPALIPSENALPGESLPNHAATQPGERGALASSHANHAADDISAASENGVRWENTNLKVQHILRADSGNGELEKIILNVPVRYETRTMRWTTENIAQARAILSRLMVYERDLNNLRQQGQGILQDWNSLLGSTVPATVLRADSPSLPYNQGYGTQPEDLPNSSSVIQVDEPNASD